MDGLFYEKFKELSTKNKKIKKEGGKKWIGCAKKSQDFCTLMWLLRVIFSLIGSFPHKHSHTLSPFLLETKMGVDRDVSFWKREENDLAGWLTIWGKPMAIKWTCWPHCMVNGASFYFLLINTLLSVRRK